jgi:hypothetical protein
MDTKQISPERLAALIVDALIDAGLVSKEDVDRAARVAAQEIEVRKALGDYRDPDSIGLVRQKPPCGG